MDVAAVCGVLPQETCAYTTHFASDYGERYGEVYLPHRIYIVQDVSMGAVSALTATQKQILHCIYSRHYNGFLRQKHMQLLLEGDIPEWAFPYILKVSDEYILQIVELIYDKLVLHDTEQIKSFARNNLPAFCTSYSRMVSYWNTYYQTQTPRLSDYAGYKLFWECFGYTESMEKEAAAQRAVNKEKK